MENAEKKLLKALYDRGKRISKPHDFYAPFYSLSEILADIEVNRDDVVDSLRGNSYLEWQEPEAIRLTADGFIFCQTEFDKRPMGFTHL